MRPSVPLLAVRGLSVTHAGAACPAPHEVSFDIHPGEVVLLLGPSSSDKSTLTLNGIIPHALPVNMTGTVAAGGIDTGTTPTATLSTRVAMVFQDPDAQIVTGTAYDEVAFGPENLLLPLVEVERRTEDALRRVGLWERRTENPDRLSGGGRQRLVIACALAMGSPLIVLDEPTANLDPQGVDDVYTALTDVVTDGERAVLLVEHNLDAAMAFATRTIVLDHVGRMAFDGPAAEVLRTHVNELLEMGAWLPAATLPARRMRRAGMHLDPLPLTPEELEVALADADETEGHTGPTALGYGGGTGPGPAADPIIRARGLSVRRGHTQILHVVNLDIERDSLTAIVGANGADKTTLIQALAGVVPPPRRRVDVAGIDPGSAATRDLAARIGFVFQNPEHQFIAYTVFDELAHGLRLRGTADDKIAVRVGEMLARFGLEDKALVHPFLLSGGEKRRLSVGTALIYQPPVLALDEPTFGQDHAQATELLDLLRGLREEGTTVIVVTHDLQLVADHATHTVVLADGRVHAAALFRDERTFAKAGLRLPSLHLMLARRQAQAS